MNEQTSFVEPLKRARRVKTRPQKLANKFIELADWYRANKPSVKLLRITKDDAWSLREYWREDPVECRKNGFNCDHGLSWRGFDLVEMP